LVLGAAGLAIAWWAGRAGQSFPVGVPILLAAAAAAAFGGRRLGLPVAVAAIALVGARLAAGDQLGQLRFAGGTAVGVGRWLELLGLLVAAVSVVALLAGRSRAGANASQPVGAQPQGGQRVGAQPQGDQRVGVQPQGDQPVGAQPQGDQRVGAQPQGDQRVGAQPQGGQRVGAQPQGGQRPGDAALDREGRVRAAQIAGLLVLSGIGAELLAAYNDSTGNPGRLLWAVIFFAGLYGAPALLIRELARRNGWGWPSLIMLAFALAILQPAVIDQSLFSTDYGSIESWNRALQGTFIEPLGISATNALNFVPGHVIYSFCAPIAIAEAWRPRTAHTPWLGLPGIALAAVAYVLTAVLILSDPESHSASAAQLAASVAAAGLCVGAAVIVGRRRRDRPPARKAPGLPATVVGSFFLVSAASAVPETWTGAAITTVVLAAGAALLGHLGRSPGWSVRHAAAVATGALLSRGVFAFFYFPLIGNVSAVPKYAHNVVMLAAVGVAAWLALRRSEPDPADRLGMR
jgi:hypothetical protein